jgi:hypothetical protein
MKKQITRTNFDACIDRLRATYGKQAYPDERVMTLWNQEGRFIPDDSMSEITSRLIGKCRSAPLLEEIRAEAAILREATWKIQKKELAAAAPALDADSEKLFIKEALRLSRGEMTEQDRAGFLSLVSSRCGSVQKHCQHCHGTGVVLSNKDGNDYAFLCFCPAGETRTENFPSFRDHGECSF